MPLRKRLHVLEWNCLAVHEKAALCIMCDGSSEGHQGTAYHPALRHTQDVSEVSQPPQSDRTHHDEHWRGSRVLIVLASDDMQASASLQQSTSRPRTNVSTSSVLSPCGEGHQLRRNHHPGVFPPTTRKSPLLEVSIANVHLV